LPRSRRRFGVYALGAALAAAVATIAVVAGTGGRATSTRGGAAEPSGRAGGEASAAPAMPPGAAGPIEHAPAPADAAVPTAPPSVRISVDTRPERAVVIHDGKRHAAPIELVVPRSERPIVLRAELGTRTANHTVVPDQDRSVTITVPAKPPRPATPPAGSASRPGPPKPGEELPF
jgi:hypothetical protein